MCVKTSWDIYIGGTLRTITIKARVEKSYFSETKFMKLVFN